MGINLFFDLALELLKLIWIEFAAGMLAFSSSSWDRPIVISCELRLIFRFLERLINEIDFGGGSDAFQRTFNNRSSIIKTDLFHFRFFLFFFFSNWLFDIAFKRWYFFTFWFVYQFLSVLGFFFFYLSQTNTKIARLHFHGQCRFSASDEGWLLC